VPGRAWADTLPFPLASILWHYEAEPDDGAKVDYLLKFFEALAQFTATVLLSACITDRELLEANRAAWFSGHMSRRLHRATFGEWLELTERLAVTLRGLLEADRGEERCRGLFRARDLELAARVAGREVGGSHPPGIGRRRSREALPLGLVLRVQRHVAAVLLPEASPPLPGVILAEGSGGPACTACQVYASISACSAPGRPAAARASSRRRRAPSASRCRCAPARIWPIACRISGRFRYCRSRSAHQASIRAWRASPLSGPRVSSGPPCPV
jgi:hypothetical protein